MKEEPYVMTRAQLNRLDSIDPQSKATRCIQDHPDEAILCALAAGAVVGLAIGSLIGRSSSESRWRNSRVASMLGERLMGSIERALPDSVTSSLGLK